MSDYMVRPVHLDDIPHLVSIGKRMHDESLFRDMDFDEGRASTIVRFAMENNEKFFAHVIVLIETDVPVGGLMGRLVDTFYGKDNLAVDVLFFVEPEHRAGCVSALKEITSRYRNWAFHAGAKHVYIMTASGIEPEKTARVLDICGFKQVGTVHEA